MEIIKCSGCGATNSARRQICHMCGKLLSAAQEQAGDDNRYQLLSEDLKAAAEEAVRNLGKAGRPAANEAKAALGEEKPIRGEKPTQREAARAHASRQAKAKRDQIVIIVSAIITVIALAFLIIRYLPVGGGSDNSTATVNPAPRVGIGAVVNPQPSRPPAPSIPAGTGKATTALTTPAQAVPTQEKEIPTAQETLNETLEQAATTGMKPYIEAIISRINSELRISLAGKGASYSGSVIQSDEDNVVVNVSFRGKSFSGSVSTLLQRSDRGYSSWWAPAFYKDLVVQLATPAQVTSQQDGSTATYSEADIGTGSYEQLSTMAEQQIEYR